MSLNARYLTTDRLHSVFVVGIMLLKVGVVAEVPFADGAEVLLQQPLLDAARVERVGAVEGRDIVGQLELFQADRAHLVLVLVSALAHPEVPAPLEEPQLVLVPLPSIFQPRQVQHNLSFNKMGKLIAFIFRVFLLILVSGQLKPFPEILIPSFPGSNIFSFPFFGTEFCIF